MKKLLITLIIILTSLTAFGQDGYNQTPEYYKQVESEVIGVPVDGIIRFCLDVTENMEHQYTYYRRSVTNRRLSVVYNPVNGTQDLALIFTVNVPSADDTLFAEKANIEKIEGSKQTLIAIWQAYFLKNATKEQIENDAAYRVLRDQRDFLNPDATGLHYRIVFKGDSATIENRMK